MRFSFLGPIHSELESTTQRFDSGVTASFLLAREIAHLVPLFDEEDESGAPYYGGRGRGALQLEYEAVESDSEFVALPAWESYGDAFLWDVAWREFISTLTESLVDRRPDPPTCPLLIFAFYVQTVTRLLRSRDVRALPRDQLLAHVDNYGSAQDYVGTALDELGGAVRSIGPIPSSRELDFLNWVDRNLPQFLHPLLLDGEAATSIMNSRSEILAGRVSDPSQDLGRFTAKRVRSHLGEPWIDGLMEFAAQGILPIDNLDHLTEMHESAARQRQRAVQLGVSASTSRLALGPAESKDPILVEEALENLLRRARQIDSE